LDTTDLRKLGVLSLINFGRKHVERVEANPDARVTALAAPVKTAVAELDLAYAASRRCSCCGPAR